MSNIVQLLDDDADGSPLALAETGDTISDLRVNGEQLVQPAAGVRATHRVMINRGNMANAVALSVTHAPAASQLAAKQAAMTLIAAIAAKIQTVTLADFIFNTATFRLSDAALQSYDIHARGTTVFASYNFSGGALAEVTP